MPQPEDLVRAEIGMRLLESLRTFSDDLGRMSTAKGSKDDFRVAMRRASAHAGSLADDLHRLLVLSVPDACICRHDTDEYPHIIECPLRRKSE